MSGHADVTDVVASLSLCFRLILGVRAVLQSFNKEFVQMMILS